ncbi:TetR family transcriptional regulator [Paenibacillus swuensis]|uniref:TetR family transcriptional regulator n=1 Tax=Paenibacillus swuensis TaxID=1178515 RepID=A0A172TKX4_9BACL|nr:TetR/AcrR family transcriptional regulator [Paenibacillus swuensis]ANE47423.1 TetR family transcriptional regulator [Paenibacillus swuensis]
MSGFQYSHDTSESWLQEWILHYNTEGKMTDKQARIVQAAIETFSDKGFAGSSTSEIAQKAGVAEGTIFRHYKTKKDLLFSIVAPFISNMLAPLFIKEFTKVLDEKYENFEAFLRAVIANRIQFVRSHLPLLKILLQEIPFQPELARILKDQVSKQVLSRLLHIVEHFQDQGQIRQMEPVTAVRLLVSSILSFVIARYLLAPQFHWKEEQEIEDTVRFVIMGLQPDDKE